jgi:hypothetical protein
VWGAEGKLMGKGEKGVTCGVRCEYLILWVSEWLEVLGALILLKGVGTMGMISFG